MMVVVVVAAGVLLAGGKEAEAGENSIIGPRQNMTRRSTGTRAGIVAAIIVTVAARIVAAPTGATAASAATVVPTTVVGAGAGARTVAATITVAITVTITFAVTITVTFAVAITVDVTIAITITITLIVAAVVIAATIVPTLAHVDARGGVVGTLSGGKVDANVAAVKTHSVGLLECPFSLLDGLKVDKAKASRLVAPAIHDQGDLLDVAILAENVLQITLASVVAETKDAKDVGGRGTGTNLLLLRRKEHVTAVR